MTSCSHGRFASKLLVALSTIEAEIIPLAGAYKEHEGVPYLFEESKLVMKSWKTYCDHQAYIKASHDTGYRGLAKNI